MAVTWRVNEGQRCRRILKGAGGLIVDGRPMGVYQTDRYPWCPTRCA